MKRTGPTKMALRQLIRRLQKASVERKQAIWKTVAGILLKPTRQRPSANLAKLEYLNAKLGDKILLVPGKVLAGGTLSKKVRVAAFEFSAAAKQKIADNKGNAWTLAELVESKLTPSDMVIVK